MCEGKKRYICILYDNITIDECTMDNKRCQIQLIHLSYERFYKDNTHKKTTKRTPKLINP